MVSVHVDCCTVKCSEGSRYERFDEDHGWGCDLVIEDGVRRRLYLCEAKRGRVTLSDANKIIDQLIRTQDYYVQHGMAKGYKLYKVFVHCRGGRIDGYAKRRISRAGVYIVHSGYDIVEKLRSLGVLT